MSEGFPQIVATLPLTLSSAAIRAPGSGSRAPLDTLFAASGFVATNRAPRPKYSDPMASFR